MLACLACGFHYSASRDRTQDRQNGSPSNNSTAQGQEIFEVRCSECHSTETNLIVGPGLAGLFSPGGPSLPSGADYAGKLPNGEAITEFNVAEWIRTGGKGLIGTMPSRDLSREEMAQLIDYLKTLKK